MKNLTIFLASFVFGVLATSSIKHTATEPDSEPKQMECKYDVMKRETPLVWEHQMTAAKRLIDRCVEDSICNPDIAEEIKQINDLGLCIELIEECKEEDCFWDVSGESDEWCEYYDAVESKMYMWNVKYIRK